MLDNCKHLLAACAQLIEMLLHTCSQLRVLVTSRETLTITGEAIWLVLPLRVPDTYQPPPIEGLLTYKAVQLFVERARSVRPSFTLTPENAPAVVQVCRRLDGMPLAIELAAARIRALAVEQIVARLDHAYRLLTGGSRLALPRQQTLRAAMDWSYDLLSAHETKAGVTQYFRMMLAVFPIQIPADSVCVIQVLPGGDWSVECNNADLRARSEPGE